MMTVKDLIEALQGMPQDKPVLLTSPADDVERPLSHAEVFNHKGGDFGIGSCVLLTARPWRG